MALEIVGWLVLCKVLMDPGAIVKLVQVGKQVPNPLAVSNASDGSHEGLQVHP